MDTPTPISSNNPLLGSLSDIAEQGTTVGQQVSAAGGNTHPTLEGFILVAPSDTHFLGHPTMANGHISTFIFLDVPQRNETHNHAYIQSPHQNTQRIPLSESQPPVTSNPTSYNPAFIPPSFQNHQQQQYRHQQQNFQATLPCQQYSLPTAQISLPSQSAYPIPSFSIHYFNRSQPQSQAQLNPNPPQYVYHTPSLPPVAASPLPIVPDVAHIPLLTNKLDFFAWDDVVTSLLRASGLIGHILDPSEPLDQSRPDRIPSILPVLPPSPTAADLAALKRWWDEDNVAQHILKSRIGAVPRGLLHLVANTALTIYQTLQRYYGTSNFTDCVELLHTLNSTPCVPGRIQEYVSKWRTGISRLQSARFSFDIKLSISQFVRGLPLIPAYDALRADLPRRISSFQNYGSFMMITEDTLKLDSIFRSANQVSRSNKAPHPPNKIASIIPSPPSTSAPAIPTDKSTTNTCSN